MPIPFSTTFGTLAHSVVRYADDLVILCHTEADAQEALRRLGIVMERLGLRLHSPDSIPLTDSALSCSIPPFLPYGDIFSEQLTGDIIIEHQHTLGNAA